MFRDIKTLADKWGDNGTDMIFKNDPAARIFSLYDGYTKIDADNILIAQGIVDAGTAVDASILSAETLINDRLVLLGTEVMNGKDLNQLN